MSIILTEDRIRKIAEGKFNKDIFRFADDARIEGFVEGVQYHQELQKGLDKIMKELIVEEKYADDGQFSHYALIRISDGETIFETGDLSEIKTIDP